MKAESPGEGRGQRSQWIFRWWAAQARGSSRRNCGRRAPGASDGVCPRRSAARRLHALIVEDESDSSDLLVRLLEGYEARVTAVASVAEALAALEQRRPDVLIGVIGLPTEDGTAIRKLRALPPERGGMTPAVAVTAFASADDRRQALELGYQAHIAKPFEPALGQGGRSARRSAYEGLTRSGLKPVGVDQGPLGGRTRAE